MQNDSANLLCSFPYLLSRVADKEIPANLPQSGVAMLPSHVVSLESHLGRVPR